MVEERKAIQNLIIIDTLKTIETTQSFFQPNVVNNLHSNAEKENLCKSQVIEDTYNIDLNTIPARNEGFWKTFKICSLENQQFISLNFSNNRKYLEEFKQHPSY